jgi:hypothetical protein
MQSAHAELEQTAEQRHFLGADLASAGKAMLCSPCRDWMAFMREANSVIAAPHGTGRIAPPESRSNGIVPRSDAASGVSASQPFGQAMPRLTGCSGSGVRLTASPSRTWTFKPQPVEQKPQTIETVTSGFSRAGTWPSPNSPGARTRSAVSGPVH